MSIIKRFTLKWGGYRIPVYLHRGMTVSSEDNQHVSGGHASGNYGQFVNMGGFAIHVSECSPDPLGTLLHEFCHLVVYQRSHLIAFGDDVKMPNVNECVADLMSDAFSELLRINAALVAEFAAMKPKPNKESVGGEE